MGSQRVAVTVGTDHHRFDRLMDWLERWLAGHPDVEMVVQHGASRCPAGATGAVMLPHDELVSLLRSSDVVVTQAGPGSVMDSQGCGFRPIVVARLHRLGEAVDDHQVAFARRMQDIGYAIAVDSEDALRRTLDAALADPAGVRAAGGESHVPDTIAALEKAVDALVASPRRPGLLRGRLLRGRLRRNTP